MYVLQLNSNWKKELKGKLPASLSFYKSLVIRVKIGVYLIDTNNLLELKSF